VGAEVNESWWMLTRASGPRPINRRKAHGEYRSAQHEKEPGHRRVGVAL